MESIFRPFQTPFWCPSHRAHLREAFFAVSPPKDDLGKRASGARVVSKSGSQGPFGSKLLFPKGRMQFYKVLMGVARHSGAVTFCWPRKVLKTGDFTPRKPELITNIGNGYENSKNAKSPHLVHNKWKNWDITDSGTPDPFLGSDPDFYCVFSGIWLKWGPGVAKYAPKATPG